MTTQYLKTAWTLQHRNGVGVEVGWNQVHLAKVALKTRNSDQREPGNFLRSSNHWLPCSTMTWVKIWTPLKSGLWYLWTTWPQATSLSFHFLNYTSGQITHKSPSCLWELSELIDDEKPLEHRPLTVILWEASHSLPSALETRIHQHAWKPNFGTRSEPNNWSWQMPVCNANQVLKFPKP